MALREFEFVCPVCHKPGSQFNDGWAENGNEKIHCDYCQSKYEIIVYPVRYKVRRAMRKNAEKILYGFKQNHKQRPEG